MGTWDIDPDEGEITLNVTFTKRSIGLVIQSEILYVDQYTFQEFYEIRLQQNQKRIWV